MIDKRWPKRSDRSDGHRERESKKRSWGPLGSAAHSTVALFKGPYDLLAAMQDNIDAIVDAAMAPGGGVPHERTEVLRFEEVVRYFLAEKPTYPPVDAAFLFRRPTSGGHIVVLGFLEQGSREPLLAPGDPRRVIETQRFDGELLDVLSDGQLTVFE